MLKACQIPHGQHPRDLHGRLTRGALSPVAEGTYERTSASDADESIDGLDVDVDVGLSSEHQGGGTQREAVVVRRIAIDTGLLERLEIGNFGRGARQHRNLPPGPEQLVPRERQAPGPRPG